MFSNPKPPPYVLQAFHQFKIDIGGVFVRQRGLNPRVYKPLIYAEDRLNAPDHLTRVMLLGAGNLIVHHHKEIEEQLTIKTLFEGAYGHLFYPSHHRSRIEEIQGQTFTFKPLESHGFAILKGYLIVQVEVFGAFDPQDLYWK
jgi:hypothetical protein